MKCLLVLCLVVLVAVNAQEPHHCEAPRQFEARAFESDRSKHFERFGRLSYDADLQRTRIVEEVFIGVNRSFWEEIYLFNEKTFYLINLGTKNCTVHRLDDPFRPIHVPFAAHSLGEAYIGGTIPGEGVLVSIWGAGNSTTDEYFGIWTYPHCMPVHDVFHSNRTGTIHYDFFDITLGISDPNVFIPPAECHH